MVDGVPLDPFVVTPEPGNYTLVTGLDAEASHSVELMKVSVSEFRRESFLGSAPTLCLLSSQLAEDNVQKGSKGAATFSRFFLRSDGDGDGKIDVSRFQSKARRIHFVGDSDTAGWCADGSPRSGDDANSFQNPYITWAGQLARSLDADYYATAISGIGVMDWPIQQYLDHTVTFDDTYKWDWTAKSGLPDAVVVLIWPNDDSSKTSKFKKSYQDLVTMLGNRYGSSIPVLHVCGGSINGLDPCDAIKEVVGVENFVSIKREDWAQINKRTNDFLGCDSHYNERGHEVLMEDVVEDVKRILGWGGVK